MEHRFSHLQRGPGHVRPRQATLGHAKPRHTGLGSVDSNGLGTQPGIGASCWPSCWPGCESRKKPRKRGCMGGEHNSRLLLKLPCFPSGRVYAFETQGRPVCWARHLPSVRRKRLDAAGSLLVPRLSPVIQMMQTRSLLPAEHSKEAKRHF